MKTSTAALALLASRTRADVSLGGRLSGLELNLLYPRKDLCGQIASLKLR